MYLCTFLVKFKDLDLADGEVVDLLPVVTDEDVVTPGVLTVAADVHHEVIRVRLILVRVLGRVLTVSHVHRPLFGLPRPGGVVVPV